MEVLPPPPLSGWGPGYRPQTEFCHGDHWLLRPLLLPAWLLGAPRRVMGENEARRGHRLTPAHTAGCWLPVGCSSSELPLALRDQGRGATRPQQDFPNASGSTRHSESYPFFWFVVVKASLRCNSHATQVTRLKRTIQRLAVDSHSCAAISTNDFRTFPSSSPTKNSITKQKRTQEN